MKGGEEKGNAEDLDLPLHRKLRGHPEFFANFAKIAKTADLVRLPPSLLTLAFSNLSKFCDFSNFNKFCKNRRFSWELLHLL